MSSGGWEVVGKNKKDKNNAKAAKLSKAEKKKFIENAPKVEDFLPLSQVKTLYENFNGKKEEKKVQKGKENKTKENEEKKKQQKHQQQQPVVKKDQQFKKKQPKSLQEALNAINVNEFNNLVAVSQTQHPENPFEWLQICVTYLNTNIPIDKEDPIFAGKPRDYPLSVVPDIIYSTLDKTIKKVGRHSTQRFYTTLLYDMVSRMDKDQPVVGHKIVLQLVSLLYPEIPQASINILTTLRDSYQNRKPICLTLLWVLSQGGRKCLDLGLKNWHEVMTPLLESKNYSSYVVQILHDLVFGHDSVPDTNLCLSTLYLEIIENIYSGKMNISAPIFNELNVIIEKLRAILYTDKNINYEKLFEKLMIKITQKTNVNYRNELLKASVDALIADPMGFSTWRFLYIKHLYQSYQLLGYINKNWDILSKSLKKRELKSTLEVFQLFNEGWKNKKDENQINACNKECETLLQKMTATTKRRFPWRKGSTLLLILIAGLVAYDCQNHGSFEASSTGKFLKDSGIIAYTQIVLTTTMDYGMQILIFLEETTPPYFKAIVDFVSPYVKLTGDLLLITRNLTIKLYNSVASYAEKNDIHIISHIEYYVPLIVEQTIDGILQLLATAVLLSLQLLDKLIELTFILIKWLETNVFVGKLSPANLQSYANQAIDTTHSYASQTIEWVYEKVQTLSKVP
ncbi:transmembrane protein 214 [Prorops nasuta]|uniref:transmembrane protein 214 n=1 Tax=Prorops nasuta TaxID=863751 RepID=UPI0034CE955D